MVDLIHFTFDQALGGSGPEVLVLRETDTLSIGATAGNALDAEVYDSATDLNGLVIARNERGSLSDQDKGTELREIVLKVETSLWVSSVRILLELNDSMAPGDRDIVNAQIALMTATKLE